MVIFQRHFPLWSIKGLTQSCLSHGVYIRCLSLFNRLFPQINRNVSRFHWVIRDPAFTVLFLKGLNKLIIGRVLYRLEVVPCSIVTFEIFWANRFHFFFGNTDRHGGIFVWSHACTL